jgi:hypothetical protein
MECVVYNTPGGMQLMIPHSPLVNFFEHYFASHRRNFYRKFVAI